MAEKKPKQSKTDRSDKKQEPGNRRSLDLAIPLYIERILVEETCGTETKRNTNKGWISAPKIAKLLETRYGVKCSTTVVRDNYLPALENYYNKNANNKNLEGAQRPAYRFERKQKEGGTIWCRLIPEFSAEEALYSLAMLPTEADIDSFSSYALYPFGAELRESLNNMVKPFYSPDWSGLNNKGETALYNFKLICQAMSERRAIRRIVVTRDDAGVPFGTTRAARQKNGDGSIVATDTFVPLYLKRTTEKSMRIFSLRLSECTQLAEKRLPEWVNGRYPEWPTDVVWPNDSIEWPAFSCPSINMYGSLELGRKLQIDPEAFEKLQGLAYLHSKMRGDLQGGSPIRVKIKAAKPDYGRRSIGYYRRWIEDYFGNCPCFKASSEGVYEFIVSDRTMRRWLRTNYSKVEVLEPQELVDEMQKNENSRIEFETRRERSQEAQNAAIEAAKAAKQVAKKAEEAANKAAEVAKAAEKAASGTFEYAVIDLADY